MQVYDPCKDDQQVYFNDDAVMIDIPVMCLSISPLCTYLLHHLRSWT